MSDSPQTESPPRDTPETMRLMDQIKIGASLLGGLTITFVFLMVVINTGATVYSRIYEQGRAAGTQDLILIMERMQKLQPVQQAQQIAPQPVQTAPSVHVQPSPYESVCRNHNGVKNVESVHGRPKITCHDNFTEYQ